MTYGPLARAAVLGLVLLAMLASPVLAVAPSHVRECDPSDPTFTKTYVINGYAHVQNITLGSCGGYYDQATISGKLVNFTNISLGSKTNPSQSFGVGVRNMNVTLTGIRATSVAFSSSSVTNTTFTAHMPKLFYYYLKSSGVPTNVTLNGVQILAASYFTTTGPFNACAAPCAFVNTVNATMIIKPVGGVVLSATFCLSVCSSVTPPPPTPGAGMDVLTILFILIVNFILDYMAIRYDSTVFSNISGTITLFALAYLIASQGIIFINTPGTYWDYNVFVVIMIIMTVIPFLITLGLRRTQQRR